MKKNMIIGLMMCAAIASGSAAALAAESKPIVTAAEQTDGELLLGVPQITVNGEAIDLSKSKLSRYIYSENDNVMVPLRAVAEKMGYIVSWDAENNAFVAENDDWKVTAYINEDLYYGVTKIKDAVGMTTPMSYGTAPQLIDDRTYVPAKMFELMGYSYTSIGQFVNFTDKSADNSTEQEYSKDTLIVSVSDKANEADLMKLFEANDMEVVYKMDTLNMYAVKLNGEKTDEELNKYIAELEKNENVLSVTKDYIMQLDDTVQIPNPFVPYESVDDAKKALIFTPTIPQYIPTGYETDEISVLGNNFLQIIYRNDKNDGIFYRTAKNEENISGDYNEYAFEKKITVGEREITVRGNDNISGADWNDGDIAYSIYSDKEISENEVREIIESIR